MSEKDQDARCQCGHKRSRHGVRKLSQCYECACVSFADSPQHGVAYELIAALREAMRHVPEERRTHKRFIDIDEAAGSTYELIDAEWWSDAQDVLQRAAASLAK